jgi:uncharacterized membrane protein
MIWLHVAAGFVALGAGAVALSSRKGAWLHRRSGTVFVYGMLLMTLSAGALAASQVAAEPIHRMNLVAAVVTAYFVASAVLTVTRPVDRYRRMHVAAMCVALAGGFAGLWLGVDAVNNRGHGPAPAYFVFSAFALLGAALDARMLRAGGVHGVHRIARHLWRMTLALLIATASFFLGQADEFPAALRDFRLLSIPVVLVLLALIYWPVRVFWSDRRTRRSRPSVHAGVLNP